MTYQTQSVVQTKLRKPSHTRELPRPKVTVKDYKSAERVCITVDLWRFPMENGRYCTSDILRDLVREMETKGFKKQAAKLLVVAKVASYLEYGTPITRLDGTKN